MGYSVYKPAGRTKYKFWFDGEAGKRVYRTGYSDKRKTVELAERLEHEARLVREGVVDPAAKGHRAAASAPVAHLADLWERALVAGNASAKHARHQANDVRRVLAAAGVVTLHQFDVDAVRAAVAGLTVPGGEGKDPLPASARTQNHATAAVKSWCRWLVASGRLKEYPKGFLNKQARPANEAADRRRVRRALTADELARLCEAARTGPDVVTRRRGLNGPPTAVLTGPEREAVYRLAAGTGFRASEVASLTRESFALDGDTPTVTVSAAYSKRKRTDTQPIRRDLAALLRRFVEAAAPGVPVFALPEKAAEMVRADAGRAGVPLKTSEGVLDFHCMRHTYISNVVRTGVSVRAAQSLARHSTPTLTLGRYAHVDRDELRQGLGEEE